MEQRIITYNLQGEDTTSQIYYDKIDILSLRLEEYLHAQVGEVANRYIEYIYRQGSESIRTIQEYELELLILGVLYLEHYSKTIKVRREDLYELRELSRRRVISQGEERIKVSLEKGEFAKKIVKDSFSTDNVDSFIEDISLEQLLLWLEATGEYNEEVIRLRQWAPMIEEFSPVESFEFWNRLIICGKYLLQLGREDLFEYLPNLESFLQNSIKNYLGREDIFFITKGELEYYLNMVGAQILNRAFETEFKHTTKKCIFLPGCMTHKIPQECRAKEQEFGFICSKCDKECSVAAVDQLAQMYNCQTYIVYHESELYNARFDKENEGIGIIGIACVLNLLSGGWKAKRLGFVPQCVLLDYCGCNNHWDKKGIATSICEDRLREIIQ